MTDSTYIERTVLNLSKSRRKVLSSYNFLSQPSCRSANCYRQYTPSPWFHFLPADLDFFASWHRKDGEESCMKTTQKVQGRVGHICHQSWELASAFCKKVYTKFSKCSIRPILGYACPVWCGGSITKLVKLQEWFCRGQHVTLPSVEKRLIFNTHIHVILQDKIEIGSRLFDWAVAFAITQLWTYI